MNQNEMAKEEKAEITNPLIASKNDHPNDPDREAMEAITSQINKRDSNPEE